jgi:putative endopeptidase
MVQAQDNFYQHVNGDKLKKIRFVPGYPQISESLEMQHKIYKQLSNLKHVPNSSFTQTLHSEFLAHPAKNGTVFQIINQIQEMKTVKQIIHSLKLLHQNGCFICFSVHSSPDFDGPNEIIYLEETSQKRVSEEYMKYLFDFFKIDILPDHNAIKNFEKRLFRNAYTFIQKKDVKKAYNKFQTCKTWLKDYFVNDDSFPQEVNFDNPKTYQNIESALILENLELWKQLFLVAWLDFSAALFKDSYKHHLNEHLDEASETPLKLHLTQLASSCFYQDCGQQYVNHFVDPQCFVIAEILINLIFQEFAKRIQDSNLQSTTKSEALRKLFQMKIHVGRENYEIPHIFTKEKSFDECYFDGYKYQFSLTLSRCNKIPNQRQFREMGFHIVNAYYITECNAVFIPAAIISNLSQCSTIKIFADHGRVIAHEIAHGFDSQARKVNADGQIQNWWSPKDNKDYELNKKKLNALYIKYGLRPKLTSAENIADIISLQVAWNCWLQSSPTKKQQIEFLKEYADAQICKTSDEFAKDAIKTDTHSHAEARTNIPLSCLPEFHTLFHVTKNDNMFISQADIPHFL